MNTPCKACNGTGKKVYHDGRGNCMWCGGTGATPKPPAWAMSAKQDSTVGINGNPTPIIPASLSYVSLGSGALSIIDDDKPAPETQIFSGFFMTELHKCECCQEKEVEIEGDLCIDCRDHSLILLDAIKEAARIFNYAQFNDPDEADWMREWMGKARKLLGWEGKDDE